MGHIQALAALFRLLLILCLISNFAAGQTEPSTGPIEELEQQLASTAPANRAGILIEIARLQRTNSETVLERTEEALALLEIHPDLALQSAAHLLRSWALQTASNYPQALKQAQLGEVAARTIGDSGLIAEACYHVAVAEWRSANYSEALKHARHSRGIQKEQGELEKLASTLTLMGAIHRSYAAYEASLDCHLKALSISIEREDEKAIARSQNNIGLVYWGLGRHVEAREAFESTLDFYKSGNNTANYASALSNLGLILIETNQPREAIELLNDVRRIQIDSGNRHGLAKALSNLGFAYKELNDIELSREFYGQALELREAIDDKLGMIRTIGSLADIHQGLNEHNQAIRLLQPALELAQQIKARSEEASLYNYLARSNEAIGEQALALEQYRKFHDLDSELIGTETRTRIAQLETQHEQKREANELAILAQLAEAQQLELARKEETQFMLIIGSTLLGCCVVVVLLLYNLRIRAERAVAESERRYRTLFERSTAPTLLVEISSRKILDLNDAARGLCEADSTSELKTLEQLEPQWIRVALTRLFEDGLSEEQAIDDCWIERSGELRWTELRSSSVQVDGRSCMLVGIRDTTEAREQEAAQLRSDKMESLGLLAGGIAHDFNNALTAILGHVSLAKEEVGREGVETLTLAERAATQASRLTSQLLAFAKGGEPIRQAQPIAELLRDTVNLACSGSKIGLEFDIADELWSAQIDKGQFEQVVSNLVINAQQAVDERGLLKVSARNFIDSSAAGSDGNERYIDLVFSDDGPGIPEEIRNRIFDPYFTTKTGGSGLGLATAYAIVNHHGGTLTFETHTGKGTTFTARFPACLDAPEPLSQSTPDIFHGEGSILVLEDEPLVQTVFRLMLEKWGYSVEVADNGETAIELFLERKRTARPFDLLIMDLTIPGGMGGREAMANILKHDEGARAIVCSGYSDDPTMSRYREAGFSAALAKPFRQADLARLVSETILHRSPS